MDIDRLLAFYVKKYNSDRAWGIITSLKFDDLGTNEILRFLNSGNEIVQRVNRLVDAGLGIEDFCRMHLAKFKSLFELRDSGIVNMMNATPLLMAEFDIPRERAEEILLIYTQNCELVKTTVDDLEKADLEKADLEKADSEKADKTGVKQE